MNWTEQRRRLEHAASGKGKLSYYDEISICIRAALAIIDQQTVAIKRVLVFESMKAVMADENRAVSYLDSLGKLRAALALVEEGKCETPSSS